MQTCGTVTHMPPELLMEGRVSPAADVFAFAVVVLGMLSPGRLPWHGQTSWQVAPALVGRPSHALGS